MHTKNKYTFVSLQLIAPIQSAVIKNRPIVSFTGSSLHNFAIFLNILKDINFLILPVYPYNNSY